MTKKLLSHLLILTLLFSFTGITNVEAKTNYTSITANGTLNTIGESILTLSQNFSSDKVDGISLYKTKEMVSAKLTVNGNTMIIAPTDYLEGDYTYTVKIITHSNKKYTLSLIAKDTYSYDPLSSDYITSIGMTPWGKPSNGDILIEIAPKPSKGFNYPYLLLIPGGTKENTNTKYMVVESNNNQPSNSLEYMEEDAKAYAHSFGSFSNGAGGFDVATELKTPLLIPIFPRYINEEAYPQFLNRESMLMKSGDAQRVDLQLVEMIKDAKNVLQSKGILIEDKVFMVGFSSSAKFAQRFTILHPEYIKAMAVGGIAGTTILPLSKYKSFTLRFPVGISDIKDLTGSFFNEVAYKKVAQYQYMGINDTNDATQYRDCYNETDANLIWDSLGKDISTRWANTQAVINKQGYKGSIQFHTYQGIGHELTDNVRADLIAFFNANSSTEIVKIAAHENGQ